MSALPLFPVTTVGSWPRPPRAAASAAAAAARASCDEREFERVADAAVLESLRLQEEAGVDIVTDGEQRRDNFYSFVAEKLDGVQLMTLAEMLDIVEDKAGFERILQTLDVPAYAISNPVCVGKIARARAARGRRPALPQAAHATADQGHAARALPADARDVRPGR